MEGWCENGEFARERALLVRELLHELLEVDAADQLHGDEGHAVRLAKVVRLDDVGMDQVGDELGLADEVLNEHLLAGVVRADDLDGDALDEVARALLLGLIDNTHATLKDLAGDLVAEIVLDVEERHGGMVGNCPVLSSPPKNV